MAKMVVISYETETQCLGNSTRLYVPASDNADASVGTPAAAADVQAPDAIDVMDVLTMPKYKLDTFSGNPLHFQIFMRVFDEQVDGKGVEDGHKLTRVLQYTTGPAKEAI